MLPCVWALMYHRTKKDYQKLIDVINSRARKWNLTLTPTVFMSDFEKEAIDSFTESFNCQFSGCLFHFGKCLIKHLFQLGYKKEYNAYHPVRDWFKRLFTLALIPVDEVPSQFAVIAEEASKLNLSRIPEFLEYFTQTWLEGLFPVKYWNHYETIGPKTNNHVEGYHNKLNKAMDTNKPNIFRAIACFKREEMLASVDYFRLLLQNPTDHTPVRRNPKVCISHKPLYKNLNCIISGSNQGRRVQPPEENVTQR